MNNVSLLGRLTKECELSFTANTGNAVCRFTLAVNRMKKEETDFINCVAFGKQGETIAQYVTKGKQLAVTGSIRTGSYDAKDGTKRYTTDIIVNGFTFIAEGKKEDKDTFKGGFDEEITPVEGDGDMPF